MRVAIVSDIHGNSTAFEAVLTDLQETAPDLVLLGGDLAYCGSSPVEVVDRVRELGWPSVMGNTDEALVRPEVLDEVAERSTPQLRPLFGRIREIAAANADALGEERIAWLAALPKAEVREPIAL